MATIIGTNRNDLVLFDTAVSATRFDDWISTGNGNDTISGWDGNDTVFAGNGNDLITIDSGSDHFETGNGNDTINANAGNQTIIAGNGDDLISGGFGADALYGGNGADVFAFGVVIFGSQYRLDTGVGEGERDVIWDFKSGKDIIDLALVAGETNLTFIGTAEFTGSGVATPELRYYIDGDRTIIQMDGPMRQTGEGGPPDALVDGEIELVGRFDLRAENFIL